MSVPQASTRKTSPNVRLVDPIKSQAEAAAKSMGVSLNALVSMAVSQFLSADRPQHHVPRQPPIDPVSGLLATAPGMTKALDATVPIGAAGTASAPASGGLSGPLPGHSMKSVKRSRPPRGCPNYAFSYKHGDRLDLFLTCPARVRPPGIVGAAYVHEYRRAEIFAETIWQRFYKRN